MIVRPLVLADAAAAAVIHVETWQDTYRGLMSDEDIDGMTLAVRTEMWLKILSQPNPQPDLVSLGAFDQHALLGFSTAGRARDNLGFQSELWMVNMPKRCQRRGVGKLLMRASLDYCVSLGAENMYLWCLTANVNAMGFYRYLGAVDTWHEKDEGGAHSCLAWNDLNALRERLTR